MEATVQSHIPPTDYDSEEHGQPAPNEELQVRVADPVRAELARQGGEHLVELLTGWLAEYDGDRVVPLFVAPWPFELVTSTATTAATPHRATPTPAAARRRLARGKPRDRSG